MQLIQIGQTPTTSIQQLIEQMAARQSAEIDQLRQSALARHYARQDRRSAALRMKPHRQSASRVAAGNVAA